MLEGEAASGANRMRLREERTPGMLFYPVDAITAPRACGGERQASVPPESGRENSETCSSNEGPAGNDCNVAQADRGASSLNNAPAPYHPVKLSIVALYDVQLA